MQTERYNLWGLVIFVTMSISLARGINFPNLWSYSHYVFTYDVGFTKRGLLGSVIGYLDFPYLMSYDFFFLFTFIIFLSNVFLLGWMLLDFVQSRNLLLIGCSMIFACSMGMVYLAHTIGYADHIGLLMTLITIRITTFWGKFLFVAPAMAVALLVHEGIWTLFFPILFLSLLFSIEESRKKRQFAGLGLLSVASLVSALWLANSHLTRAQAQAIYESIQAKADVPLREDAFHVLHRSVEDNLSLMQNVWSNVSTYVELLNSLVVIFPVLLICIGLSVFILRQTKGHFVPLVIPASLSPLVMNCVGWDLHRWSMMSTISGFLTLYVVWARHGCPPENSNRIVPLLAFGIFLVSVSNTVLSDGHRTKDFPFVQHQRYLYDVIFGHGHFPHVPSQ